MRSAAELCVAARCVAEAAFTEEEASMARRVEVGSTVGAVTEGADEGPFSELNVFTRNGRQR